jgi:hypothetical protein
MKLTIALFVLYAAFYNILHCRITGDISSRITKVTVYRSGALIERETEVDLVKGVSTVRFTGLPEILDKKSLTITRKEGSNAMILDYNFLKDESVNKKRMSLSEKIEDLGKKSRSMSKDAKSLSNKTDFFQGLKIGINAVIKKKYGNAYSEDIKKLEKMIFEGLETENMLYNRYLDSLSLIDKEMNKLSAELDSIKYIPLQSLVTNIQSHTAGKNTFVIKYFIGNAGWYPFYNLNIISDKTSSEINIMATVYQDTGEDWKDVKITVSNETPAKLSKIPALNGPQISKSRDCRIGTDIYRKISNNDENNIFEYVLDEFGVTELTQSFTLSKDYTLSSGNRDLKVKLESKNVKTKYQNILDIKKGSTVEHMVSVVNNCGHTLVKGNVNLFLNDEFKGKDLLNEMTADDSLTYTVGKDNNISFLTKLKEEKIEDQALFSSLKTKKVVYDYTIKNHGKTKRKIVLKNTIPASTNKEVKVKIIQGKWTHDTDNGKIQIEVELEPGQEKILPMGFSIEYPGDKFY